MNSFSIRKNLANVAVALLLATPSAAAPPRLMGRGCLASIVADLSCADSSIMTHCTAIETVDVELLATCLEAAGCTPDEAENALWITEKCQTGPSSDTEPDLEGELRRRSLHARNRPNMVGRADTTTSTDESTGTTATETSTSSSSSETSTSNPSSTSSSATSSGTGTSTSSSSTTSTTTTSSASATSTSSSSRVNIGLSSAIVGTTLGIAAVAAFGGVFICAWREGAAKRKAKREAAQKEALLANMG
ncbi:hypothetical protein INS49_003146 [Diaporthe citri]|uniref:uncharacterized protein n=1 Tax=Diaporthe citri TaxID=83186 RepID=UPI001C7F56EE|nr:uncharacterized protein INS49_003146 [Diaporthe citri]KAG6368928.1 hypothetical protein INS49_003146 [Diaporthe citri]